MVKVIISFKAVINKESVTIIWASMVVINHIPKFRLKLCLSTGALLELTVNCLKSTVLFRTFNGPNQPNYSQTWSKTWHKVYCWYMMVAYIFIPEGRVERSVREIHRRSTTQIWLQFHHAFPLHRLLQDTDSQDDSSQGSRHTVQ